MQGKHLQEHLKSKFCNKLQPGIRLKTLNTFFCVSLVVKKGNEIDVRGKNNIKKEFNFYSQKKLAVATGILYK